MAKKAYSGSHFRSKMVTGYHNDLDEGLAFMNLYISNNLYTIFHAFFRICTILIFGGPQELYNRLFAQMAPKTCMYPSCEVVVRSLHTI